MTTLHKNYIWHNLHHRSMLWHSRLGLGDGKVIQPLTILKVLNKNQKRQQQQKQQRLNADSKLHFILPNNMAIPQPLSLASTRVQGVVLKVFIWLPRNRHCSLYIGSLMPVFKFSVVTEIKETNAASHDWPHHRVTFCSKRTNLSV